ncbi:MAG TPA: pyridoxal 5'-phosphate synthase glutaminase subunit PdxT [Actinomycetota bacterium]|nr:pyridoxal 5'-phosphate synthase glutaminase subunit PdxT [Actinomycetota bacterium]
MKVGVLALQGDFREHGFVLRDLGVEPVEVRTAEQLQAVEALVIPGGESTAIGKLARQHDLIEPIVERARDGMPMLGTCAGMIVMAERVNGFEPLLGLVDVTVTRNAYGRQVESFEADLEVRGIDEPVRGVFIRAPQVDEIGEGVEVLASYDGKPVVVEQGNLLAAAFHPELVGETRLHGYLLRKV